MSDRQKQNRPARMYGSARMSGNRARRFARGKRPPRLLLILAAALVVLAVVLAVVLSNRRAPADTTGKDRPAFSEGTVAPSPSDAAPSETPAIGLAALAGEAGFVDGFGDDVPIDDGTDEKEGVTDDTHLPDEVVGTRPTAPPGGYLPIFSKAKTDEKIIAITVDDCFQIPNLDRIIDCAVENDALLTIFPIGKVVEREALQIALRKAHELGMEIENHSYNHAPFYKMSAESMAAEIFNQNRIVSYALGVNYQMHFMRTRGGDNRRDLRTHQYIDKLGYYGMAHWTMSGSSTGIDKLKSTIEPGNIYLFHTTDGDLRKLLEFIPYAKAQGYRMVTLNQMFGYPENEVSEITTPLKELEVPAPDPYVYEYKELKPVDYLWDVNLLQQRLIELGWLKGKADGVYGKGTYMAVGYFQLAVGQKANGKATPEMQEALFAPDAPRSENGQTAVGTTLPPGVSPPAQSGTPGPATPVPTSPLRVTLEPEDLTTGAPGA